MRAAILLVVATCAFVGVIFAPGEETAAGTSGEETEEGAGSEYSDIERRKALAEWSSGETVLQRSGDGHFYADVEVNGSTVNFLVDTGASMVALSADDARAVGLSWSDSDIRVVAQGASGPVQGVPVMIDVMRLGGHEARNVEAAIVTDGLQMSLLGQSFLTTVQPLRIENDEMVLGE